MSDFLNPGGLGGFGNNQPIQANTGIPLIGGNQGLGTIHPFAQDIGGAHGGLSNGPTFDTRMAENVPRPTEYGSGAIKSVRVISCNFCEMVEQATMGFRPFVSNVTDSHVIDRIPQFVREQRIGANFKAESLNDIVHDIVGLSGSSLGTIPIVNGWNTRRYSFTLMVEVVRNTNQVQQYMIEGFTDTPELSTANGGVHVDRNMVLYVNNVVSFAQRSNLVNGGLSMVPVENFNVIANDPFAQNVMTKDFVTQRPYDVANNNIGGILAGNTSKMVIDGRSSIATAPKTSNASNNNPASYLAKIINDGISAISASNTDNLFNSTSTRSMLDSVAEPSLSKNGFLQVLGKHSRDINSAVTSFTWSDLTSLDNALANPNCQYLNVYPLNNRAGFLPGSGLMCDDITGSGNEQVFAQSIANGLVDLMARCEATEVSIMASNHSGYDDVEVTGMRCYDQNKLPINVETMAMLFKANIMQMMNSNMQFSYNVAVSATLWGEIFIKINLGHGTHTFMLPNFASAMYSPMLTNNKASTLDVSRHLLSIANTINVEQYNMQSELSSGFLAQSAI